MAYHAISAAALMGLMALHRYRLLSVEQFARASDLRPSHVRDLLRIYERQKLLGSIGNAGLRGGSKAPKLYYLTRSGYEAMREAGGYFEEDIGPYVKPHTGARWTPIMAHRLATIDLLLSVEANLPDYRGYRLIRSFHEYRRVRRGTGAAQPETSDFVAEPFISENRIVPDAGFVLENTDTGQRGLYFIETDRGTERLTSGREGSYSVFDKFQLYERYLRGGRFAQTYARDGDFRFFTVLFVTISPARIANTQAASRRLDAQLHPYFRLASLERARLNIFAPIWVSRAPEDEELGRLIKSDSNAMGGTE